jgi:dipeptidyl aminopeptidase/acylaminoacyl peptidase
LPREEDHRIVDWDDAETRFLVHSVGARQPGMFYVYDARERTLKRIGETMPALNGKPLAKVTAVAFTARDGLSLEGYVTLPAGISKQNPAPLVVLPHGSPAARDSWLFNAEAQFLASLGYAVLQPNYRGSSGYLWAGSSGGQAIAYAAMRDDVIDATRTALESGLFDPARVAVMGSSFGAYLALACSVEEPALYRCAVSVCGVFDWAEHVKSKRDAARSRPGEYPLLLGRLGDPRDNEEAYAALSPLSRLDRLRVPMLIAHGREDSVASVKQSRLLARELRRRDLPHQTFYRSLAGHGFYTAKDRLAFYQTVQQFLAENLATPAPAPKP